MEAVEVIKQETLALYFTLERKFAPDAVQGGYVSVLSVSTVTTEKGKSLSFFPIFMTLVVSLFLQPWVLRCCSASPSTDAVKSAARADSALQLQVSGNYTLIIQKKLPKQPFRHGVTTECLTLSPCPTALSSHRGNEASSVLHHILE